MNYWKIFSLDKILTALLVLAVLLTAVTIALTRNRNAENFTELYILNEDGKAYDYPQDIVVGQQARIILVVENEERKRVDYSISVCQDNGTIEINGEAGTRLLITLDDREVWQGNVNFAFNEPGEEQRLEFDLYIDNGEKPYLSTFLKINVGS